MASLGTEARVRQAARTLIAALTATQVGENPGPAIGLSEMDRADLIAFAAFTTGALLSALRQLHGDDLPNELCRLGAKWARE